MLWQGRNFLILLRNPKVSFCKAFMTRGGHIYRYPINNWYHGKMASLVSFSAYEVMASSMELCSGHAMRYVTK